MRNHPTFHVSQLKPVSSNPVCPSSEPPPPAWTVDDNPAYLVRRLLDVRHYGRGYQYLVNWEGYDPEERSWVPLSFILDLQLNREFNQTHSDKSDRLPGGSCWPWQYPPGLSWSGCASASFLVFWLFFSLVFLVGPLFVLSVCVSLGMALQSPASCTTCKTATHPLIKLSIRMFSLPVWFICLLGSPSACLAHCLPVCLLVQYSVLTACLLPPVLTWISSTTSTAISCINLHFNSFFCVTQACFWVQLWYNLTLIS